MSPYANTRLAPRSFRASAALHSYRQYRSYHRPVRSHDLQRHRDMHHLGNVRTRTTFVDDCHTVSFSSLAIARARTTPPMSGKPQLGYPDSAAACLPAGSGYKYVINRNVEETLNLFSVQIPVSTRSTPTLERKSATTFAVLVHERNGRDGPGAHSQSRGYSGDTTCGSTTQGINHND